MSARARLLLEGTRDVLAGGSLGAVARRWNAAGSTTTTGKPWTMTAVRRVLMRARNAALMEHQGKVVGAANWAAVVPEAEWRAVVSVISDPSRRTSPGPARRWLGSGIYTCAECDQTVIASSTAGLPRGSATAADLGTCSGSPTR
jgi:hypothetical protein